MINYRDFFKKEIVGNLKDEPKLSGVDPKELEMGIKHEMEHTDDEKIARIIASHHLKDDPHYYSKLKMANIKENEFDTELPKLGGALAVAHIGQPISIPKIVQIGKMDKKPATGALSGMTPCEKKGVAADENIVKVTPFEDKEPITAGGHSTNTEFISKTVGGEVVPGGGQIQGGPNTKGTYGNTPKLDKKGEEYMSNEEQKVSIRIQDTKEKIGQIVSEALNKIRFNEKTGRWERINEARDEEIWRNAGQSEGGFKPNVFEDNDEVEIEEQYNEEEESQLQEQYFNFLTKKQILSDTETEKMKKIKARLDYIRENKEKWIQKAINPKHKGYCTPMTKKTCTPRRKALALRFKKGDLSETEDVELKNLQAALKDLDKITKKNIGKHIQAAGMKDLEKIHQDIEDAKKAGKVYSFDDID